MKVVFDLKEDAARIYFKENNKSVRLKAEELQMLRLTSLAEYNIRDEQ